MRTACLLGTGIWLTLVLSALAQPPRSGENVAGSGWQPGPPPGMGGPGGPPSSAMFNAIDTDSDGVITMRELRKAVAGLKKLDTDKDGKITQAEAMGGPPDRQSMIDRAMEFDKDGDGKLSKSELPEQLAQMLENADTNHDGAIDRAELTAATENFRSPFGGPGGGGQRGFGGANGFAGDPRPSGPNLSQYDRNGDGQLSTDEVPPQLQSMLRGADQNGNGVLDGQELQAIQQRITERVRGQRPLPPGVSVGPSGIKGTAQQQR